MTDWFKVLTYFCIGYGGTLTASPDPVTWRSHLAAVVAGLVAVKALFSNPNTKGGSV